VFANPAQSFCGEVVGVEIEENAVAKIDRRDRLELA
jgi:hypothetical protein